MRCFFYFQHKPAKKLLYTARRNTVSMCVCVCVKWLDNFFFYRMNINCFLTLLMWKMFTLFPAYSPGYSFMVNIQSCVCINVVMKASLMLMLLHSHHLDRPSLCCCFDVLKKKRKSFPSVSCFI